MKVVIDTNIQVSGVFFGGLPRKIIAAWADDGFELLINKDILAEYQLVLLRIQNKRNLGSSLAEDMILFISKYAVSVEKKHNLNVSCNKADNKFVNCALDGQAVCIVSGDSDLLELERIQQIEVLTARQFVEKYLH